MSLRLLVPAILLSAIAGCADAGEDAPSGAPVLAIDGARIWDGTGAAAIEDGVLVVRGDRIAAVGPRAAITIPEGATIVDAKGKTLIPGLINAHGHVGWTKNLVESSSNYSRESILEHLGVYARYGVTTVMSLGTDTGPMFDIRGPAAAGEPPRANVFIAGKGFAGKGGYPTMLPHLKGFPYEVDTPEQIKSAVEELAGQKVDMVKIWVDDHFGTLNTKIRPELYKAIIDEAHAHNLRVVAHVFYLDDARGLVQAGIDGLVHSVRDRDVDDAFIASMKEKGTFLAPTLSREMVILAYAESPAFLDDPFLTRLADPEDIKKLKDPAWGAKVKANPDYPKFKPALETAQRNFKRLFEAGVKMALGTDTGPPARFQGYLEHVELEMMVNLGVTPAQALEIATRGTAENLGIAQDYGSLETGKRADLLLLDADPLESILNTRKISKVWVGGREVN